jgi:hypothetical protein
MTPPPKYPPLSVAGSPTISDIMDEAFNTAKEKGWHDPPPTAAEEIALMHSELSEALESLRKGEPLLWFTEEGKPEGIAAEYADVIIRIADVCRRRDIPLISALKYKMLYNRSRPYRHGGKAL